MQNEIVKRENISQAADQGTSRLYGHLMPSSSSRKEMEDIELLSLDHDGDTEKNDGFSLD